MEPIGLDIVRAMLDDYAVRQRERLMASVRAFEHLPRPPTLHERMADAGVVPCAWVPDAPCRSVGPVPDRI